MNTFQRIMHCDGCTGRLTFQRNVALLALGKSAVDLLAITFLPGTDTAPVALSWLNPFAVIAPWMLGHVPLVVCVSTLLFFAGLVWNSVHRLHDVGWSHWFGLLTAVPFVNLPSALVLACYPPSAGRCGTCVSREVPSTTNLVPPTHVLPMVRCTW